MNCSLGSAWDSICCLSVGRQADKIAKPVRSAMNNLIELFARGHPGLFMEIHGSSHKVIITLEKTIISIEYYTVIKVRIVHI